MRDIRSTHETRRVKLPMRATQRPRWLLALAAAVLVATASTLAAQSATGASTTTLRLWMASGTPEETGVATLVKKFEATHPGVKVEITYKAFADYTKILPLKLASSTAPDVVQGNQGYSLDSTLVKRKLIIPLDTYANKFGWIKLYGQATLSQYRLRSDGKWDGKSQLYGVGHHADFVGVFYNKAKLAKLGFKSPPKTMAQFEAVLAKAAAGGEAGYLFGNQDGISGTWTLGSMMGYYGKAATVRNWLYGQPGSTFANAANAAATNKLRSWVTKGYVTEDFNGVAYPDSITAFSKGEGVFLVTGSWVAAGVQKALGTKVGFMNLPPGPSGKYQGIGANSLPWHVSSKSKDPDLAAELVDTLVNKAAGPVLLKHGRIPSFATPISATKDRLLREIVVAWEQMRKDGGQLLFIDWSTPTMLTALEGGIQEVLAGKTTTTAFLAKIQKNWVDFQKSQPK
jgi:raffinose/stachyose/melibiose transport system substrate-binding protein